MSLSNVAELAGWASGLDRFGEAVALLPEDGPQVSYAELMRLADGFAARLGGERRLVLLGVRNDVASVAAYLGCLRGGHPVLLLAAGEDHRRISDAFRPDAVWDAASDVLELAEPGGGLHPALAVLLSTSGSTGSPKLVRLSGGAVAANAASICAYLDIGPGERAVTTLPFHYSYGLSVLNSHLMAGASIALTELSVAHPDFAALLERVQPTSMAGVPYTHELLAKTGLVARLPASVRTLTQAGGRLAPEKVRAVAQLGGARGFRFVPMYGQTEATARMAYLPPELAELHPDCIGRAIPGGELRLVDEDGAEIEAAHVAGELVYRGPNVMMGYALERADLAGGAELDELRTGDIAERVAAQGSGEALFRIVGRASRFAKIAGLRIGFDDVEAMLRAEGVEAVVTGSDALLALHLPGDAGAAQREAAVALVAARAHVPEAVVAAVSGEVPRLPTGKVDYGAIRRAAEAEAATREAALAVGIHPILAGFRRAFNSPKLGMEASFQSLGGDSLAYVNAAIAVEKSLGSLPAGWEEMPISALVALDAGGAEAAPKRRGWTEVGTDTLVRVWALVLVILGHGAPDSTGWLRGGATVLMLLAGYSFARFQRTAFERGHPGPVLKGSVERMILPYFLFMIPMLLFSNAQWSWGWFLMLSTWTVEVRGPLFAFWFLETVFHALLLMALLYLLPPVRRLSKVRPFETGLLFLLFAVLLKMFVPHTLFGVPDTFGHRVNLHFYLYVLGFLVAVSRGTRQRLIVLALAIGLGAWDFGLQASREYWLALGAAALLFVAAAPVPARLAGPLLRIAAASYFIYVIHVPLHHVVHFVLKLPEPWVSVPVLLVSSAVAGLAFDAAWSRGMSWVKERFA
ncbi:AMP-binding protein [Sandaracinobacteroides hominis]|uniref:AMP-binding protein n=1 Tax=Sandaracinobacteroides hominis TaxID=2780086 RepID=UPI0018F3C57D|nr:AMP-binding protein [Sandaracinobacteroides hominis]